MVGRRLNPNSDAWGGAWGSVSAWGGTWGWSWSPLHEVEEYPERYYGGGGRYRGRKEPDPEEQLHRDHWDYMDSLREIQAKAAADKDRFKRAPEGIVLQAPVDAVSPRAMRGKVEIVASGQAGGTDNLTEITTGNPLIMAALLALIDDE